MGEGDKLGEGEKSFFYFLSFVRGRGWGVVREMEGKKKGI